MGRGFRRAASATRFPIPETRLRSWLPPNALPPLTLHRAAPNILSVSGPANDSWLKTNVTFQRPTLAIAQPRSLVSLEPGPLPDRRAGTLRYSSRGELARRGLRSRSSLFARY